MKIHFYGLIITITDRAIVAILITTIAFILLLPKNSDELYSDYAMWLGVVYTFLCGIAGLLFVEVEGEPI